MSIQSTTLTTAKTDYTGLKEPLSLSIERNLLEKIDSLQGVEKSIQPKFMEVLDNTYEVQPKTLSKKDVHAKNSKSGETLDFKSSKNNNSFPSNSMVNPKEKSIATANKSFDKPLRERQSSAKPNESFMKEGQDEKELIQTTISLATPFLKDTLQDINLKQNLPWKNLGDIDAPSGQLGIGESGEKMINDVIQIEMLSPLKEGKFSLDDDQMKLMTDLLSAQTEMLEDADIPLENTLLVNSSTGNNSADSKSIVDISLLEAITEGRNRQLKEEKAEVDSKVISSPRNAQAQVSSSYMDKITPITETQTNFGSMGSGFSQSSLNGSFGIGTVSYQSSGITKSGLGVEGSMAQTKLDQLNTLMQVKDHFKTMLNNKESHLKVILTPEELGTVEITFDILKDTVLSTFIKTERRETMELLSRHAEEIDMLFKNAGLQSDLTNMNFSSSQQEYVDQENASWKKDAEKSIEEALSDLLPVEAEMMDSDTLINIKA